MSGASRRVTPTASRYVFLTAMVRNVRTEMILLYTAYIAWCVTEYGEYYGFDIRSSPHGETRGLLTSGAYNSDWGAENARDTPAILFGSWERVGFRSDEDRCVALKQLSLIEGCDWASGILKGLKDDQS